MKIFQSFAFFETTLDSLEEVRKLIILLKEPLFTLLINILILRNLFLKLLILSQVINHKSHKIHDFSSTVVLAQCSLFAEISSTQEEKELVLKYRYKLFACFTVHYFSY